MIEIIFVQKTKNQNTNMGTPNTLSNYYCSNTTIDSYYIVITVSDIGLLVPIVLLIQIFLCF